jgi:two-component system nitrogen regulation response regulator NtrX
MTRANHWILVVDDDDDNRELIVEVLNHAGYDATSVDGGSAALALLKEQKPCLVLTDLWMRDMDGVELLRQARDLLGAAVPPFVFVTGVDASRLGDVSGAVLTKPLNFDHLVELVGQHCGAAQSAPI